MPNDTPDAPASTQRPSKSQIKRDMLALQALGKQLVELSGERLKQLSLPEALFDAVRDAQRISQREGRRRQVHYVGKLLRTSPPEKIAAIEQQLLTWRHGSREAARAMHRLEAIRDVLLENDEALTDFLQETPQADSQQLRTLIRAARKEAQQNAQRQLGQEPQRKHYRALYQALKLILDTTEAS